MGWSGRSRTLILPSVRYLVFLSAILAAPLPAIAQPACVELSGACFKMLEGYSLQEVESQRGVDMPKFIKFGGKDALARELPVHKFDAGYIDSWVGEDAYRMLKVMLIELPPGDREQTPARVAERFHNGFASRWGSPAFAVFDEDKQIGHSTNVAGAFIGAHVTRCGSYLVAIEAMDVVEFLKLSNADYRGINDPDVDARWRAARATSNTDDAEALIANICAAIGKTAD